MLVRMILACVVMIVGVSMAHAAEEHTKDSLKTVKKNVEEKKAVLVDVRSQEEWDEGTIEGAIFLPHSELQKPEAMKKLLERLPKDRILYTYCVVGKRSLNAAELLKKHGYDVRSLKPGYKELLAEGFPKAK